MHTVKRTLADPTWWPFVICSSPALFAWIIWKLHLLLPFCWRRTKGASQQTPNAHPDPLMFSSNDTKLLNHKMNRWCESWILNTEESIAVCFKTVNSSENRYSVVTKNWIHLSVGAKSFCFCMEQKKKLYGYFFIQHALGNVHLHPGCQGDFLMFLTVFSSC